MIGDAASKQQLKTEFAKLPDDVILRWHNIAARLSSGIVLRYQRDIELEHLDEWIARVTTLLDEMSGFRKSFVDRQNKALSKSRKRK